MGIQINGQTDTISAVDGSLSVSGADLTSLSQLTVTGVGTFGNGLRVTGGTVGVNTTAVDAQLEVHSAASKINTATIKTSAGASGYAGLAFMAGQTTAGREKAAIYFQETNGGAHYTGDLVFALNSNSGSAAQVSTSDERLRITSSGRLGIGTNNPSAKLDVEDNAASGYIAEFRQKNSSNLGTILIDSPTDSASRTVSLEMSRANTLQWAIGQAYNDSNNSFHIATSSLQGGNTGAKLTINKTNGYVGIGSANPNELLEVRGTENQGIRLTSTASSGEGANLQWYSEQSGDNKITAEIESDGESTGGNLFFRTRSLGGVLTERLKINSNGFIKQSPTGTYYDGTGSYNEFHQDNTAANVAYMRATNASYVDNVLILGTTRTNNAGYNYLLCWSNGTADNEFLLRGDGNAYADGSWNGGGADYAEYFEWSDANPDEEDRRGISVVLDGDKIREAVDGEDPIGVISGNPSVVGDAAWNKWSGKYLRDEFGTYIQEDYDVVNDEGETVVQKRRKLNPAYNPDQEYISREQRPEWDCVGLMGKLRIRKGQVTGSRWIKMRDISNTVEEWLVR